MKNSLNWTGASIETLPHIWSSVEKFISQALEQHGYFDIDHLYYWDKITRQEMQLWILYEKDEGIIGVMITELYTFMHQHVCNIPICAGGNVEKWEEFMETVIEPWCKEKNVDRIEFRSRKACAKILTRHNYYVSDITLTKNLTSRGH